MLIIGHRGAAGLVPENTIRSFQKAQQLGVDMVETDLRLNSKGRIVLNHDALKAKHGFRPTLKALLTISKVPINLEVKESGFEAQLLKEIQKFSDRVVISSFQVKILKKIRALDENIRLGLILGRVNAYLLPQIPRLDRKLNLYSVHPNTALAQKLVVGQLQRWHKKVFVWTVNRPAQLEKLKALGVDGVFTDYPNLIRNHD